MPLFEKTQRMRDLFFRSIFAASLLAVMTVWPQAETFAQLTGSKPESTSGSNSPQSFAPPGLPGSPTQTPIDGGVGLLAMAGGAYALRKMRSPSTLRSSN